MKFFLTLVITILLTIPSISHATVASSTSRIKQNCNGVLTAFTFTFNIEDTTEVAVIVADSTGAETTLVAGTEYATTCVNNDCSSGGTVTLTTACASLSTVTILRDVDVTQESDFTEGMAALYETFEQVLDKNTRIDQQQQEEINRAPLLPETSSLSSLNLPNPAAGYAIGWNASANGYANISPTALSTADKVTIGDYDDLADAITTIGATPTTLVIDEATVLSNGETLTIPTTLSLEFTRSGSIDGISGGGTETLVVNGSIVAYPDHEILKDNLTVTGSPLIAEAYPQWFGVTGDGTTDDTAAINEAVVVAAAWDKGLFFPSATYVIGTTTNVSIPVGVSYIRGGGVDKTIFDSAWTGGGSLGLMKTLGSLGSDINAGNAITAISQFDKTITFTDTVVGTIAVGDVLLINQPGVAPTATEGTWNKQVDGYDKGEYMQVSAIAVNVVTLSHPTYDSYTAANTTIQILTPSTCDFRDFTIEANTTEVIRQSLYIQYWTGVVERIKITGGNTEVLGVIDGFNGTVKDSYFEKLIADSGLVQSSVSINGQNIVFDNNYSNIYRHAVSVGGSGDIVTRAVKVINSTLITGGSNFGVDTHGYSEYVTFDNNQVFSAVAIGGNHNLYTNNFFQPWSTTTKMILFDRLQGNDNQFIGNTFFMPSTYTGKFLDGTGGTFFAYEDITNGGTFVFRDNLVITKSALASPLFQIVDDSGVASGLEQAFHFIDNEFRGIDNTTTRTNVFDIGKTGHAAGSDDFTEILFEGNYLRFWGIGTCARTDTVRLKNNFVHGNTGNQSGSSPVGSFVVAGSGAVMEFSDNVIFGYDDGLTMASTSGPAHLCKFTNNSITSGNLTDNLYSAEISAFTNAISTGNIVGADAGTQSVSIRYGAITNLSENSNQYIGEPPVYLTTVAGGSQNGPSKTDDGFYSFKPNKPTGVVIVTADSADNFSGVASYRAEASGIATTIIGGGADFEVSTGPLTGTTGTDAKVTMSAATDEKIYIENRSGGTLIIHTNIISGLQ